MIDEWPFDPLIPLKYGAILADPPWAYAMRSGKGYEKSPEAHYSTMSLSDIKALPVAKLAGPACLLVMWSTWPHLPQALEVLGAWGFTYCTGGAWVKRTRNWKVCFGTGYLMRGATEPFIVGRLNRPVRGSRSERNAIFAPELIDDLIDSERREHSRKPPEMRELIERLAPGQHCAELFARQAWHGHSVWGNETELYGSDP